MEELEKMFNIISLNFSDLTQEKAKKSISSETELFQLSQI